MRTTLHDRATRQQINNGQQYYSYRALNVVSILYFAIQRHEMRITQHRALLAIGESLRKHETSRKDEIAPNQAGQTECNA
jgi:hypothetical protein